MLTGLDHIIIGVNDLEQATTVFSQKLGLTASGGGVHPSGGTANRIIVIGDTYLELIAVRTPGEAQQSMLDRLAKGDGYLNFVLSSNAIEADSKAMLSRGVSIIGPKHGQLRSTEGRTRAWSRADVEQPDLTQHYPFLIQHDSTGEERRFRLAGWTQLLWQTWQRQHLASSTSMDCSPLRHSRVRPTRGRRCLLHFHLAPAGKVLNWQSRYRFLPKRYQILSY